MQNNQSIYTLHRYHTPQFLPTGQYGLCFGYLVLGLLAQKVTFYGAMSGSP